MAGLLLSLLLIPLYAPLSLLLAVFEALILRRGGTIQIVALRETPAPSP